MLRLQVRRNEPVIVSDLDLLDHSSRRFILANRVLIVDAAGGRRNRAKARKNQAPFASGNSIVTSSPGPGVRLRSRSAPRYRPTSRCTMAMPSPVPFA
jgi:hypothetical protein